jgi:hypothetical protein
MMPFHCPIEPNEHALGWLTRLHLLSGNIKYQYTAKALGVPNQPLKSGNHNEACKHCLNLFKCPERVFTDHTVFGLWSLSFQQQDYDNWRTSNSELMPSGFEPNKFAFQNSWKYCPSCIEEDIEVHGHSLWHAKHQLPSITHCFKHCVPLLSDRVTLRDLRTCSLPQAYQYSASVFQDEELMLDWSIFVSSIYEKLNSNPTLGSLLRERIQEYLKVPNDLRYKDKPLFVTLQEQMDAEVPQVLLKHLFLFYVQEYKHPPAVIWSTLGYSQQEKAKHPVYWLVILYWLKDKISLGI